MYADIGLSSLKQRSLVIFSQDDDEVEYTQLNHNLQMDYPESQKLHKTQQLKVSLAGNLAD